jgi:hypothetical protein
MKYLTLTMAKQHLLVDASVTEDDSYITQLCDVAEAAVEVDLDRPLVTLEDADGNLPAPIIQAMLLTVGNLYANREPVAIGTIVTAVPYTFEYLKGLYKKHALA